MAMSGGGTSKLRVVYRRRAADDNKVTGGARALTTARTYIGANLPVIATSFTAMSAYSFTSAKIGTGARNPGDSRAFPPPDSRALWAPSRRHRHVDFTLQHRDGDIDRLGCRGHHFGERGGAYAPQG